MENWRLALRDFLGALSPAELAALKRGVENRDPELIRGRTTNSRLLPDGRGFSPLPCHGACLLGYPGWKGRGLKTCGEVEQAFDEAALSLNHNLGHAAVRWLTNWHDEHERPEEQREELLAEVALEEARRAGA